MGRLKKTLEHGVTLLSDNLAAGKRPILEKRSARA
jgi:hypothetical protein